MSTLDSNTSLVVAGITIRQDADGRYCINDLHQAAVANGANSRTKEPGKFLSSPQTIEIIDELTTQNLGSLPVVTVEGRNGGTYGCRELVYTYAMWVSAAFHLKVIRAYDALVTGQQQGQFQVPKTFGEALQLAADQWKIIEAQREQIERDQPKVEFHDEVAKRDDELTIRETVKLLFGRSIKEAWLAAWLKDNGWLCKTGKGREVTAYADGRGYMHMREEYLSGPRKTVTVAVITGKGLALLRHLIRRGDLFLADVDRANLLPAPERAV